VCFYFLFSTEQPCVSTSCSLQNSRVFLLPVLYRRTAACFYFLFSADEHLCVSTSCSLLMNSRVSSVFSEW